MLELKSVCWICNKQIDKSNEEYEEDDIYDTFTKGYEYQSWHIHCHLLEILKEEKVDEVRCGLCNKLLAFSDSDVSDYLFCPECKEKYK